MCFAFLTSLLESRICGLLVKEFRQIFRNKLLLYLLLVPPIIQLLLIAAALDPELHHIPLAISDQCDSKLSRDFLDLFQSSTLWQPLIRNNNPDILFNELRNGRVKAVLVIPKDFDRQIYETNAADLQTVLAADDAYTANVARSYLHEIIFKFKTAAFQSSGSSIESSTVMLYNRTLNASWYFIPGILGSVLALVGTLVSSAALIKERELGTLEGILVTPVLSSEIILAKILPIFLLLMADVISALILSHILFALPFGRSPWVLVLAAGLFISSCVGCGLLLGSLCRSQRQAQLFSFFMNIPIIQLSGSVVPFESMPAFLQNISRFDPLRYFTILARACLLKDAEILVLWPYLLILALSAVLLLSLSVFCFRKQLA
ncbi:MAG: ABC transporter permease [Candidatus Obscuribacterales bacterium]|nr:ABC transporter permease [Candidatus Obscuribacterales bacterium]